MFSRLPSRSKKYHFILFFSTTFNLACPSSCTIHLCTFILKDSLTLNKLYNVFLSSNYRCSSSSYFKNLYLLITAGCQGNILQLPYFCTLDSAAVHFYRNFAQCANHLLVLWSFEVPPRIPSSVSSLELKWVVLPMSARTPAPPLQPRYNFQPLLETTPRIAAPLPLIIVNTEQDQGTDAEVRVWCRGSPLYIEALL